MADKIATREAYGDALKEFGAINENIVVLDADLAEATKTIKFKKAFPERFFDCGIAENNMLGVCAGLASTGKIHLHQHLLCLPQAEAMSKLETQSVTHT